MKRIITALVLLLVFSAAATACAEEAHIYKVRITVGDQELIATFADNATSRYLIGKMPMTLPMMNLYGREDVLPLHR